MAESAIDLVHHVPRYVKELDFSDNPQLGPKFGVAVANDIVGRRSTEVPEQYYKDLRKLVLENCGIGDAGGSLIFVKLLERERDLKTLNVSHNGMTEKSAEDLARLIEKNTNLQCLFVHQNALGAAGGEAVATALGKNSAL